MINKFGSMKMTTYLCSIKAIKMNYAIEILSLKTKAERKVNEASRELALAELSKEIYVTVFDLSLNGRFAYQVASEFTFERVMNSKEFTDHEKEIMQPLIEKYKAISK